MQEWKLTAGIVNSLFVAYVFGAFPGHFWIVYVVETSIHIGLKFNAMWHAKPLCQALFYLDFCWIMNFVGLLQFVAFEVLGKWISSEVRRNLFLAFFGVGTGPVFLACMALPFVAFLFHDVNTMANLVTHILPSMLLYIMRWKPGTMQEAYPSLFDLEYAKDVSLIPFFSESGPSIGRNGISLYLLWLLPYTAWMVLIGLDLPRQPKDRGGKQPTYDTVFHCLWRTGPCELVGSLVWKRPKALSKHQSEASDFEKRDLFLYMACHCFACINIGLFVLARLCHSSQAAHGLCIFLTVGICAHRGGQRYTYYATAMYGREIRKQFSELQKS